MVYDERVHKKNKEKEKNENMKQRKNFLFIPCLAIMFLFVGCGQQVAVDNSENSTEENSVEFVLTQQQNSDTENVQIVTEEDMSSDFYLLIEDTFSLVDRNDLVVVGVNNNSALHTGAEVDVISSTGRIQTQVLGIEKSGLGIVDSVESGANIGVMLAGVTKEQVNPGDLLVLRDEGVITDEATALVAILPVDDNQTVEELTKGQNVKVIMFDTPMEATITSVENISEEDENIVFIGLEFMETFACQNYQGLLIRDENDNLIATGHFRFH